VTPNNVDSIMNLSKLITANFIIKLQAAGQLQLPNHVFDLGSLTRDKHGNILSLANNQIQYRWGRKLKKIRQGISKTINDPLLSGAFISGFHSAAFEIELIELPGVSVRGSLAGLDRQ
jgi:hypothetical protein